MLSGCHRNGVGCLFRFGRPLGFRWNYFCFWRHTVASPQVGPPPSSPTSPSRGASGAILGSGFRVRAAGICKIAILDRRKQTGNDGGAVVVRPIEAFQKVGYTTVTEDEGLRNAGVGKKLLECEVLFGKE